MVDGSLKFDTKIDSKGFESDINNIEKKGKSAKPIKVNAEIDASSIQKSVDKISATKVPDVKVNVEPKITSTQKIRDDVEKTTSETSSKFKKAYDDVEKSSDKASREISKNNQTNISDSKKLEQSLSGIKSGFGGITSVIKGVALGYTGKTLVDYFIGSNADMEQYLTSFEVMLGDAQKASDLMSDLRNMAAVTPFETTDLANASKTLMSFGVELKDVQTDLQMLGDISQGNGEKFKSLALVFGQIKSAGKLMGQDLLQLVNVGFNPLQTIANQTGKSMADLKKDMENGKISFEMVAEAMKTATSEGGLFYKSMEKQSQTMTGMLSTLKDNLAQFGRDAGEKAFEQVKGSLQSLLDMIDKAAKDGTLDDIAEDIGNALNALVTVLIKAAKFIYEYKTALIAGAAAMATFKAGMAIGGVITAAITAYRTLKIAIDAGTVSQLAMNGAMAANPIGLVIGAIGALVAVVGLMTAGYNNAINSAEKYNEQIQQIKQAGKDNIKQVEAENELLKQKAERYEELRTKASRTSTEESELKSISEDLLKVLPAGTKLIDDQTGAYKALGNQINDVISKRKLEVETATNNELYTELTKQNKELQTKVDEYVKKRNETLLSGNSNGVLGAVDAYDNGIEYQNFLAWMKQIEENKTALSKLDEEMKGLSEKTALSNMSADDRAKAILGISPKEVTETKEVISKSFEDLLAEIETKHTRGLLSDEQYYIQKDKLLKDYNKSELSEYDSFYGSIKSSQDSANKEYLDNEKKTADEAAKAWQDSFENISKDYESKAKDIENQQNALAEKLSSAELFSRETVGEDDNVLILTNFQEKFQELEQYQQLLDEIRSKGAGEAFANQIKDMGVTDAVDFMQTLLKSDDIDGYLKGMEQYNAKANEIAQNEFADENQAIKDEFANEVVNTLGEIPAQAAEAGTATAEAFAEALVNSDAIKKIQSTLGIQDINSFLSAVSTIKSKAAGEIATGSAVSRQAAASVPIYAETGKSNNAGIIEIHTTVELDRNKLGESVTKWQTERGYQSGKRVN